VREGTSGYGPAFWVGVAIGWGSIGWGVWLVMSRPGATEPAAFAAYLVGLALLHDLVVAPAALGAATLLRRRAPRAAVGILTASMMASAVVVAFAVPFTIDRAAANAANPSFLPRSVMAGAALVLALIWLLASSLLLVRVWQRGGGGG
jgi:hypothetical protein